MPRSKYSTWKLGDNWQHKENQLILQAIRNIKLIENIYDNNLNSAGQHYVKFWVKTP